MCSETKLEEQITVDAVTKLLSGPIVGQKPKHEVEPEVVSECMIKLRQLVRYYYDDLEVPAIKEEEAKSLRRFWLKMQGAIRDFDSLEPAAKDHLLANFEFVDPHRFKELCEPMEHFVGTQRFEYDDVSKENREQVIRRDLHLIMMMADLEDSDLLPFLKQEPPVKNALQNLIFRLAQLWTKTLGRRVTANHQGSSEFQYFVRGFLEVAAIQMDDRDDVANKVIRKLKRIKHI